MRLLFFFPTLSPPPHFTFFLYLHLTGQCDDISRYHFLLKTLAHVCNIRVCVYVRAYVSHATCVPVIEYTYCIVCPLRMNMLYISFFMQLLSFSLFLSFTRTIILSSESHHHHCARTFSRMPFICSILFIVYYSFFFSREILTHSRLEGAVNLWLESKKKIIKEM